MVPNKPGNISAISRNIACCMLNLTRRLSLRFEDIELNKTYAIKPEKGTAWYAKNTNEANSKIGLLFSNPLLMMNALA